MVNDVLTESERRLNAHSIASVEEIRSLDRPVIAFSQEMQANNVALKHFLFQKMYRHERVNVMTERARRIVRELFEALSANPDLLPRDWRGPAGSARQQASERSVSDYIAGMTDNFAMETHRRLIGGESHSAP